MQGAARQAVRDYISKGATRQCGCRCTAGEGRTGRDPRTPGGVSQPVEHLDLDDLMHPVAGLGRARPEAAAFGSGRRFT